MTADPSRYDIVVAPAATRAPSGRLPEAMAAAVIDFITGPLLDNPQRLGRELGGELAGLHSARRGTFRILYRIDEKRHEVAVQRIEHRGDVYRPPVAALATNAGLGNAQRRTADSTTATSFRQWCEEVLRRLSSPQHRRGRRDADAGSRSRTPRSA